ncbi:hypothetical protein B0H11DRAFT_2235046 [Mycena galericulata]|nr:hypothetical protein B0H11DRAFT_2235046 [Mycena galericulata]
MPPKKTPATRWLEDNIRIPRWKKCSSGSHSATIYSASNHPIEEERFGEISFHCTGTCTKASIALSTTRRLRLRTEFLEWKANHKEEVAESRRLEKLAESRRLKNLPEPEEDDDEDPEPAVAPAPKRKPSKPKAPAKPKAAGLSISHIFNVTLNPSPAKNAESVNTTQRKSRAKNSDDKPARARAAKSKVVTTGKTKAVPELEPDVVEDDQYDTDSYEILADERRRVELIIYTDNNKEAIRHSVNLRAVSHFEFRSLNIAKVVGAVSDSDSGLPYTHYVWYCPLRDQWFPVGQPINLRRRGEYVIFRVGTIPVTECPEIRQANSDAEDERDVASVASNGTLTPAPSSSLKRKRSRSSTSFLDEQAEILEAEDEEDEEIHAKLRKMGKDTSYPLIPRLELVSRPVDEVSTHEYSWNTSGELIERGWEPGMSHSLYSWHFSPYWLTEYQRPTEVALDALLVASFNYYQQVRKRSVYGYGAAIRSATLSRALFNNIKVAARAVLESGMTSADELERRWMMMRREERPGKEMSAGQRWHIVECQCWFQTFDENIDESQLSQENTCLVMVNFAHSSPIEPQSKRHSSSPNSSAIHQTHQSSGYNARRALVSLLLKSHLYLKRAKNDTEAMLRELAGEPDERQFNCDPCPKGFTHELGLNTGDVVGSRVATWEIRCPGFVRPTLPYDGFSAERCRPQYGKELPLAQMREVVLLKDDYRVRNDAVVQLFKSLGQVKDALAILSDLGTSPPLPEQAAHNMSRQLESIRHLLGDVQVAVVPADPDVLERQATKGKQKSSRISTFDESDSDSDADDDEMFDPKESQLKVLLPMATDETHGRRVHVIFYIGRGLEPRDASHALFWLPRGMAFLLANYPLLPEWSGVKFHLYCPFGDDYGSSEKPVNMIGRGNFMIYRQVGLGWTYCRWLSTWEERARDSAQYENKITRGELSLFSDDPLPDATTSGPARDALPPSSDPAPSSSPIRGGGKALASSSKAQYEEAIPTPLPETVVGSFATPANVASWSKAPAMPTPLRQMTIAAPPKAATRDVAAPAKAATHEEPQSTVVAASSSKRKAATPVPNPAPLKIQKTDIGKPGSRTNPLAVEDFPSDWGSDIEIIEG